MGELGAGDAGGAQARRARTGGRVRRGRRLASRTTRPSPTVTRSTPPRSPARRRPAISPRPCELAEQGEKYDAEHNGGGRAVEFGLKKAQLFVKMKDADKAVAAFDALIAKHPDEGKFYTTAAEEMLRLKNGAKAAYFAEKGLAKARETEQRRPRRSLPGTHRRREEDRLSESHRVITSLPRVDNL